MTRGLTGEERDRAVDDFIELVAAVDGMLRAQAAADASYFAANSGRAVDADEVRAIEAPYRWPNTSTPAPGIRISVTCCRD